MPILGCPRWWPGDAESAASCLEICLDALSHVDANANLTTLAEWWLDELGQTARGITTGQR